MTLSMQMRNEFRAWAKYYFTEYREGSTAELYDALVRDNPTLAKKLERVTKKMSVKTYIGRYLLRSFMHQGWLKHDGKRWVTQPSEDYCTYCFRELDPDIYLLDIDHNLYCDDDCFFEAGTVGSEDGYWDDYMNLFYEFQSLFPEARSYTTGKIKAEPLTHLHQNHLKVGSRCQ